MKSWAFAFLTCVGFIGGFVSGFSKGAIQSDLKIQELQEASQKHEIEAATCRMRLDQIGAMDQWRQVDPKFTKQEVQSEEITL